MSKCEDWKNDTWCRFYTNQRLPWSSDEMVAKCGCNISSDGKTKSYQSQLV